MSFSDIEVGLIFIGVCLFCILLFGIFAYFVEDDFITFEELEDEIKK